MKFIKIMIISFYTIMILSHSVFALEGILNIGESWIGTGINHANVTMDTNELDKASSELYSLLLVIATAIAVIVGAILGVQYMTAGIDEKVKVKESLYPYIISCIIVFGSFGIWGLVVSILKNI